MRTTTMVSAWTSNPSLMVCGLVFATCSPRTLELLVFGLSIVLAGVARLRSPANYSCHLQSLRRGIRRLTCRGDDRCPSNRRGNQLLVLAFSFSMSSALMVSILAPFLSSSADGTLMMSLVNGETADATVEPAGLADAAGAAG